MRKSFISILMILLGIWVPGQRAAFAGEAELKALLDSPSRPTMSQVLEAIEIPFGEDIRLQDVVLPPYAALFIEAYKPQSRTDRHKAFSHLLPKVIAHMEHAYPGAIWAPLGRDAVLFGDLLEIFYLTLGQTGRVARLNASTKTILGIQDADAQRVKFLESAGLSVTEKPRIRPFVGLDRTAYWSNSQSVVLLKSFYDAYERDGGSRRSLLTQVGFIALDRGSKKFNEHPTASLEKFFRQVTLSKNTGVPTETLKLPMKKWTDSSVWHEAFEALEQNSEGKFEGRPGVLTPIENRTAILGELLYLIQEASKAAFFTEVQSSAREFDYEFPASTAQSKAFIQSTRAKTAAYWEAQDEIWKQGLQAAVDEHILASKEGRISRFLNSLVSLESKRIAARKILGKEVSEDSGEYFAWTLEAIEKLVTEQKVLWKEYIFAVAKCFQGKGEIFLHQALVDHYKKSPMFRDAMRITPSVVFQSHIHSSPIRYENFYREVVMSDAITHVREDSLSFMEPKNSEMSSSPLNIRFWTRLRMLEKLQESNPSWNANEEFAWILTDYLKKLTIALGEGRVSEKEFSGQVSQAMTQVLSSAPRSILFASDGLREHYRVSSSLRRSLKKVSIYWDFDFKEPEAVKTLYPLFLKGLEKSLPKRTLWDRCAELFDGTRSG